MIAGREIVRAGRIASTMDLLAEFAMAGAQEGLVVLADEQTAGRGRAGRSWVAPPGSSLLCSVLLRPTVRPDRLGVLALLCGVAVARAIESVIPVACRLKWPNDVLIGDSKVAGILLHSQLTGNGVAFVIVGIGINVEIPESALEPGATSLGLAGSKKVLVDHLIEPLCQSIDDEYAYFSAVGGLVSLDEWRNRAAMIGEQIVVVRANDTLEGRFLDIDNDGRLILERDQGERFAISEGDVRRGPRPALARGSSASSANDKEPYGPN